MNHDERKNIESDDDDDDDASVDESTTHSPLKDTSNANDCEKKEKEARSNQSPSSSSSSLSPTNNNNTKKIHRLSLRATHDFNAQLRKRGVLYLARVPPRFTPTKVQTLLHNAGAHVTRVYLAEQQQAPSSSSSSSSKSSSGRSKKRYREGWIEVSDQNVAKQIALSLHLTRISPAKRSAHYDDVWNLKYLPKFQWSHLTEKVAYERRVQEQKLRLETMQAKNDTARYQRLVETGQKLDKIQQRLRHKKKRRVVATVEATGDAHPNVETRTEAQRPSTAQTTKKQKSNVEKRTKVSAKQTLLHALV